MPFGEKPDASNGPEIDFDASYAEAIEPGIEDAGMIPIRADEEEFLNRRAESRENGHDAGVDRSRAQEILEGLRTEQGPTAEAAQNDSWTDLLSTEPPAPAAQEPGRQIG